MCDRCEALQYLLDEITAVPPEVAGLAAGLTAGQARMVGVMLGRPGVPMTRAQITAAAMVARPYADWPTGNLVDSQISYIRKRLGPDSPIKITTHQGVGYSARIRSKA